MNAPVPFEKQNVGNIAKPQLRPVGRVGAIHASTIDVRGLERHARIGDSVVVRRKNGPSLLGEIIQMSETTARVMPEGPLEGCGIGDRVVLGAPMQLAPHDSWVGRVMDANGKPLDGMPLRSGERPRSLLATPPDPILRGTLGPRFQTGFALFNTILPIARGQRLGLFAGSGVGKSSLIGNFAKNMDADIVVISLVGERGRELRHFLDEVLGPEGKKRSIVVAATSDQSPLARRRAAWAGMTVAEHFRDQGANVLFLMDSVTRFAEAHREIAIAANEAPVLRGFPPSTTHTIMSLCERAGPGANGLGDITAIFSVLVAGSDMEEPIADILRGVLDGHVVLDRAIAERGRFPAVDVLRSVSRSLPACADEGQNKLIADTRKALSVYEKNVMMITAGLYSSGTDTEIDHAIDIWPELDAFAERSEAGSVEQSFSRLEMIFRRHASKKAKPLPSTSK